MWLCDSDDRDARLGFYFGSAGGERLRAEFIFACSGERREEFVVSSACIADRSIQAPPIGPTTTTTRTGGRAYFSPATHILAVTLRSGECLAFHLTSYYLTSSLTSPTDLFYTSLRTLLILLPPV